MQPIMDNEFLTHEIMKKYLFIGLLACTAFFMSSCRECNCTNHGDVECNCTNQGDVTCKYHAKTIDLIVGQNEWKWDDQAQQFYVHFPTPEITADILAYGNFSLHRIYNVGTTDEYQTSLPETTYLWENVDDGKGGTTTVYYHQLIDYRVGIGYVEIQLTNSDFTYAADAQGYLVNPDAMRFHLQLIY